jgi:hypothetical protein
MIEGCSVCCRPVEVTVVRDEDGDPHVTTRRSE